jgi:hypothetical protein
LRDAVVLLAGRRLVTVEGGSVGDLCAAKGEEQKHKGAAELCGGCDELIAPFVAYKRVLLGLFGADCDVTVGSFVVVVMVVFARLGRGAAFLFFMQREEVLDTHGGGLFGLDTRLCICCSGIPEGLQGRCTPG